MVLEQNWLAKCTLIGGFTQFEADKPVASMEVLPASVKTFRVTVSEAPCSAVLSILVNVLKGLKLPALAVSSSISAAESRLKVTQQEISMLTEEISVCSTFLSQTTS